MLLSQLPNGYICHLDGIVELLLGQLNLKLIILIDIYFFIQVVDVLPYCSYLLCEIGIV